MKILITENSLDDLLNVKISVNGGQSYTDYEVSSLKDGLTLDYNPSDLKVICDVNTLKYIKVFAEGEVPSGAYLENNKEVEITENGEIEITPSAGKDGMKKVTATVNVPPVVTEPPKVITRTFTPKLNTPYNFITSVGPGGYYGFNSSYSFSNNWIKASDISEGIITTARITWGPGASQGYYVDFSLAVSVSDNSQKLTITPTAIGSAWGTGAAQNAYVCFIL